MAPSAGHFRPVRYLAFFIAIIAVLYGLVFGTGDHKPVPKLGIDLKGGTRVVLTARTLDGNAPSQESLNQARQIIETRVNGQGINGAEVVLDGNNIVITVPGDGGEKAKELGQTATLGFRKVIEAVPNAPQQPPGSQTPPTSGTQPPPSGSAPATPPAGSQTAQPPASGSNQPQGRPAPQLRQQQPSGSNAPSSPSTPPPSAPPSSAQQPAPPSGNSGSVSPEVAAQIKQARDIRQNPALATPEDGGTAQQPDTAAMQTALASLNCEADDPLVGNDDPNLPLVACDEEKSEKFVLSKVFLKGEEISDANSGPNSQGAGYVVNLTFDGTGADIWAKFTAANVGKRAAFVLDTKVVSAPEIKGPIPGGNTEISGNFNQRTATALADVLKYGSLPLSFQSSDAETVSATLGLASLQAGLIAGAIGLGLVFVYCLFYYRLLGVLTILSLVLSFAIVYAIIVLFGRVIGYSLDLAGVAGLIVAIGFTADSFVVFFERLKDEMREGRTFRSAVPRAWARARRTILSADAVLFLSAAVLYLLAVGQVKGFAFTLGMSTVLDLIVVFLVTHPLVAIVSKSKRLSNPKLVGLGAAHRESHAAERAKTATGGTGPTVKEA
ncbi:protein translocase subunit SecD [Kibdelosporangium phytohabitans]|uniref:Protein translocase subunit SecD n=1 Tax=Kibdelosporangium phytohabitans TaxID=860235 RepID=A0A0N9I6R8_9PSEU|nr:protein translocase subunit SecD [Kibdelosporangium phytohabitans]ALG11729.1 preprotein translocase subunit SecD [Kibdelosporangium phytohabitans]MBE1463130.1 preprotein translocase subunit SecD [Kibdelosporangium phytohabitans]